LPGGWLKDDKMTHVHLLRRLDFKESFAIVVGSMIGTGVFLKTAVMAQEAGTPLFVLLAWLAAGLLSFMGALVYAGGEITVKLQRDCKVIEVTVSIIDIDVKS
jgi:amino acid permease